MEAVEFIRLWGEIHETDFQRLETFEEYVDIYIAAAAAAGGRASR